MSTRYIKQTSIDKILEDCDIVKVAEKFGMTVKKSGVRYKALCPFHNDSTPSLTFYKDSNQCHCFSCGAHANVISLVQKIEGYDFRQAAESLAKDIGIELEYEELTDEQEQSHKKHESLLANMAIVEKFYREQFLKSEKAQQYAYNRWGKEFCDLVCVGYAPDSICNLNTLGIRSEILEELGLTTPSHDDMFQDRLTISIRDRYGRVIGFICRSFDGSKSKYLNNCDSQIFHKGEVLFGADMAWKAISKTQTAYLVEGAPDCYRLHSIGISNTVACLGSSWTDKHFTTLNRVATKVVFIPDSDVIKPGVKTPPGMEAVMKGGKLALQHGLTVYVKEIPQKENEKQDADSYFTDKDIFDGVQEQDFVLWYAGKQFDGAINVEDKTLAVNRVVNILADLNDQTKTAFFVAELSKRYTEGKRKVWTDALKQVKTTNKAPHRPRTFSATPTNMSDPKAFGFEVRGKHYVISNNYGETILSNFLLTPEFHVLDSILSRRIFTIENDKGDKNIIELRSDELVSNDKFRAKLMDIGNYSWKGGKEDLLRLSSYLMANTDTALQIRQLGWRIEEGFFAFGNGIHDGKEWHEADNCGIVRMEGKGNFYLPSHSSIYRHDRKMFFFEHNFIHKESATLTLREITDQIFKVFGDNGRVAFLFLLACIYHDIVVFQTDWFPLLDLFGPIGTGKTALAETMAAFFTKKKSININNATLAAMSDEVAAAANAVVVLNEYKNSIDDSKVEFLKGAWDLFGRNRFTLNKDGQREMTAVDSGIILTGQEMPTKDNALFSRTIFLTFATSQFSQQETEEFQRLASMREHGLTHLTIELLQYRKKMENEYSQAFYEACKNLKAGTHSVAEMERIINNWAVLLAIYKVLKDDLNINIDYNSITSFVKNGIRRQSISCKTSDEMASFWNTLQYLLSCKSIFKDAHYRVVAKKYLSNKDGKEYMWDDFHSVIFIRKAGVIELYQEACRRIGNAFIPKESLEFYLTHASYYLGTGKQRFNEIDRHGCVDFLNGRVKTTSQWAYYFDYEAVKRLYEIDLDPLVSTEEDEEAKEQELDLQPDKHEDVPF